MIGFDLETHLIQDGLLTPPIVCGSFAGIYKQPLVVPKRNALAEIRALLHTSQVIAGANIPYDFGCICAEEPNLVPLVFRAYQEKRIHDVQVCAALDFIARGLMQEGEIIDPRTGAPLCDAKGRRTNRFSLETCVDLYLGRKDAKESDHYRLSYALLEHLPISEWPPEAVKYPGDDAQNTFDVAQEQLRVSENLHDLPTQCYAHWCAHLGAIWGFRTDGSTVDQLAAELEAKLEAMKVKFSQFGLFRQEKKKGQFVWVKTRSALQDRVSAAYNGKPPRTEPTDNNPEGNISTERTVLEDSGDEVLEEFAEVSKVEKLQSYMDSLRKGARAPLNVNVNILLASGRASYEGMVQLMPRKGGIRERCIARPEHVWSSVDYAAIEAHTLGQVLYWTVGRSVLADTLNADKDPHCLFVANMTGLSYEEVVARVKAKDVDLKDKRQGAKAANYGFPGGMSAPKFVQAKRKEGMRICQIMKSAPRCSITKLDWWNNHEINPTCEACCHSAEQLRQFFMATWEEMHDYFEWIKMQLRYNDNALEQFVSKRIRGGLRFTSGANTLFQGLAADGAKRALIRMTEEMYLDTQSPLYGSRLMIFAHDETILEIPENRDGLRGTTTDAGQRQARIMVEEMEKVCPDMKKIKAEPAFMRRWYKDAEPVWVSNDEGVPEYLVPWEPKKELS